MRTLKQKAGTAIYLNTLYRDKNNECSISLRVTFRGLRRYYPVGMNMNPQAFNTLMAAKRRNGKQAELYNKLWKIKLKADEVIDTLPVFSFERFEDAFLINQEAPNNIAQGFDRYIKELREENRFNTATSYLSAKRSLLEFNPQLTLADITKQILTKYELWMLNQGSSKTTIGIYLRALRSIYNQAGMDPGLYPFGKGKTKYSIPSSRNIKKALSLEEVSRIFHYQAQPGSTKEMARDYWLFIYLCNGMNVKDMCLLKRKNIAGDILTFERAKTSRTRNDGQKIIVSLKKEAKEIIRKWCIPSIDPDSYLFPHLNNSMSAENQVKVIHGVTKMININMKQIAEDIGIHKQCTTYYARHSYATILRNSGASIDFISHALGHGGNTKTTNSYLDGFEVDTIHKTTDVLTAF